MNKVKLYFTFLLASLLITACNKDDNNLDSTLKEWKKQNDQAFNDLSRNPEYKKLALPGSNEYIYYKVIKQGEGIKVNDNCRISVNYIGRYVTTNEGGSIRAGQIFDQTAAGKPFIVSVVNGDPQQLITGWKIALKEMKEGDKWEIYIPYQLAYGVGYGPIPGYTTLAFDMEIERIELPVGLNTDDLFKKD